MLRVKRFLRNFRLTRKQDATSSNLFTGVNINHSSQCPIPIGTNPHKGKSFKQFDISFFELAKAFYAFLVPLVKIAIFHKRRIADESNNTRCFLFFLMLDGVEAWSGCDSLIMNDL
jgi:hypothetical protein